MMSLREGATDGWFDWERRSPACSLGYQTSPVTGAVEKRFQRLTLLSSVPVLYSTLSQYPVGYTKPLRRTDFLYIYE